MRRFMIAGLACLAAMSLSACNSVLDAAVKDPASIVPGITVTPLPAPVVYQNKTIASVEAAIQTAQAATVKACRYRPAASFLLKVAATFTNLDEALSYVDTLAVRTCVAAGASVRADAGPPTSYASLGPDRFAEERRTGRVRGVPVAGVSIDGGGRLRQLYR